VSSIKNDQACGPGAADDRLLELLRSEMAWPRSRANLRLAGKGIPAIEIECSRRAEHVDPSLGRTIDLQRNENPLLPDPSRGDTQ
jgi:hypothetical protein